MSRLKIRVTKDDQNSFKYELMQNGEKICDITFDGIVASLAEFVSLLGSSPRDNRERFNFKLGDMRVSDVSYVDIIEMTMQFASSLRFDVVK